MRAADGTQGTADYETITYDAADGILTLTLNRPDKLNAFTHRMMAELIDAFDRADADDAVRAVIVTGAANSGDIELCSECGLAWPPDSSIRWIPSDKVAHILAVENDATHLKQRVRAFLAPAHVSVALHTLADHVVDSTLGAGT